MDDRRAKQGRDRDLGLGFSASIPRSLFLRGELSLSFAGLEEEWNKQQWRKGKMELKLERTAVEKSKIQ